MDWGILGGIGSVIGGIGSLIGGVGNVSIGEKNYALQKEAYEWQKGQWDETKRREDTAVQRRVSDMKAAGLNPVLAAGQAAQVGQAPQLHAPQRESLPDMSQSARVMLELIQMGQNIATSVKQRELMESQSRVHEAEAQKISAEARTLNWDQKISESTALKSRPGHVMETVQGLSTVIGTAASMLGQKVIRAFKNAKPLIRQRR